MLRFAKPPDNVFQAILRSSFCYAIDLLDDMILNNGNDNEEEMRLDGEGFMLNAAKVYSPALAKTTLVNLLRCLDRPELYNLNDYHYLLIHDVLANYIETKNNIVAESEGKDDKKEASVVGPFYIEEIHMEEILDMYFDNLDFLIEPDVTLDLSDWLDESFRDEAFEPSQEMMPYPEELELEICTDDEDTASYKVCPSDYFGPTSKVYPDYDYYFDNCTD